MDTHGNDSGAPHDAGRQDSGATDTITRLRHAITTAKNARESTGELRAAARALVGELRRAEEPPEQMLLRIKQMLAEAGLRPSYASDSTHPIGPEAVLYREVIMWSIRDYYDTDEA